MLLVRGGEVPQGKRQEEDRTLGLKRWGGDGGVSERRRRVVVLERPMLGSVALLAGMMLPPTLAQRRESK